MALEQHEDNRFTKERDDVEKYLLRIIQRYFDIQNVYTQESIEAIIIESLTRYKQSIFHEKGGFIFSLNQKTGHIILTISDLGGEEAFEKQSAFNKDFGNEADTICEGNDPRLEDKREPLQHEHEIADVKGLVERLKKIIPSNKMHIHKNKNILDMITYTGTKTEIDLIILDYLEENLKKYYDNLLYYQREEKAITNKTIEDLSSYITIIEQDLDYAKSLIKNAVTWLEDAYKYTDNKVDLLKDKFTRLLLKYMTQDDVQLLKEYFSKMYYLISDGEIAIPDGQFQFTSVIDDTIIEASSEDGDSLKDIYDNGLRLGVDDWAWDDVNKSFVYQQNVQSTYPMFISLNKFSKYTHRVTLSSTDSDDDLISVVIAYDEDTGNHLSLLVSSGGVNPFGVDGGAAASIVLNYTGNYIMYGDLTISSKPIGSSTGWNNITNGVTVLVKRNENNIKIWINFNKPNTWFPEEIDGLKDIYPTETPDFEFNLNDYSKLSMFVDTKSNYGYGCYSQDKATYRDVFFIGNGSTSTTKVGHANVSEENNISINLPTLDTGIEIKQAKTYFRYDLDEKTITVPIPFIFKTEDGNMAAIQLRHTDNNYFIETNMINVIPSYITQDNFYDSNTIIAIGTEKISYDEYINKTTDNILCLINSQNKNNFVSNLLTPGNTFYIQGEKIAFVGDTDFRDNQGNVLSYYNWDSGQPISNGYLDCICINENAKWETSDIYTKRNMIFEYKLKHLSDYFQNPRIYYQIFGTQEVT